MLEFVDDNVIISRQTWDELKSDSYFSEIIDVIEEREALLKAKSNTTSFIDLEDPTIQSRRSQEWRKETAEYHRELKQDLNHGVLKPISSEDAIRELHKFVEIEKDADGWLIADIPVLKGCHTQAKSYDDLIYRTKEAIELCLEVESKESYQEDCCKKIN